MTEEDQANYHTLNTYIATTAKHGNGHEAAGKALDRLRDRVAGATHAARESAIRDCALAMGNSGDFQIEHGEAWLLRFFASELSPAREPGR